MELTGDPAPLAAGLTLELRFVIDRRVKASPRISEEPPEDRLFTGVLGLVNEHVGEVAGPERDRERAEEILTAPHWAPITSAI